MKNEELVKDYLKRSQARMKALAVLFDEKSWADVVRESQEVSELVLKAILRASRIDPPRLHDVSATLEENKEKLPVLIQKEFYGSEDLTPSVFYQKEDAEEALEWAKYLVQLAVKSLPNG